MWRRSGLAVGAMAVVITMVWAAMILARPGLADWDIMAFYLPWYAEMGERLRGGDIPGWNPYIFSGTPFAGNPQSGWAYLPVMILFTALPPLVAFGASIWLHLVGAAIATFVLARLLGLGLFASVVAGLAYALTANLGVATCCTNHLQLAPWLPLSLVGVEVALRQRSGVSQLGALGVSAFAFSQMAAAWVGQGTYNGALLLGGYLVWRGLSGAGLAPGGAGRRVGRTIIGGVWVFGLGGGLAAMGLLPRLDVVRRSYVGSAEYQGEGFAADRGLDWWRVGEVLLRLRLDWFPYHLGGAVVTLALIGAVLAVRRQALGFFVLLAVVLVVLPMRPTPLHDLAYLLPRFRDIHLHDPARMLALLPLPIAILAGAGVDGARRDLTRRTEIAAVLLVVGFWGWALWLDLGKSWSLHWSTVVALALVVIAALAMIAARRQGVVEHSRWPARMAAALVVVAIVMTPAGYATYRWVAAGSDEVAETAIARSTSDRDPGGAGQFLQGRRDGSEQFRYLGYVAPEGPAFQAHEGFADPAVIGLLANNRAMRLGLTDVQGYDPAQLVRYQAVFAAINGFERDYHEALVYAPGLASPLLDLLGVRYVVVPADDRTLDGLTRGARSTEARYREVFTDGTVRVLENSAALPRAWIVHEARETTAAEALRLLSEGAVDPRLVAMTEVAPPSLQPVAGVESAEITRDEPDRVALDVVAASDGLLVLGDVYDPGWRVYVDGRRSRLYVVDGIVRGVAVAAGSHVVEFRYEPRSLQVGLAISAVSLVVLIVVGVAGIRSRQAALRQALSPDLGRGPD